MMRPARVVVAMGAVLGAATASAAGEIARLFVSAPDLILLEGYKDSLFPKVEVLRQAQDAEPLSRKEDQLIALVTDSAWDLGVTRFGLDDAEGLAGFLIDFACPS